MPYFHQQKPILVPVPGGKTIAEHTGLASTGNNDLSIAHMVSPPGWGEPFQNPAFDEYTLISRGQKQVEVDGKKLIVKSGESILIKAGSRVRYSNPFEEACEYWSICKPAFSIETVNREQD